MDTLKTLTTSVNFNDVPSVPANTFDTFPIVIALLFIACIIVFGTAIFVRRKKKIIYGGAHSVEPSSSIKQKNKFLLFIVAVVLAFVWLAIAVIIGKSSVAIADNTDEYPVRVASSVSADVDPYTGNVTIESGYIENAGTETMNISVMSTSLAPGISDGGATWTVAGLNEQIYSERAGEKITKTPSILLAPGAYEKLQYSVQIDPEVAKSLGGRSVINMEFGVEKALTIDFATDKTTVYTSDKKIQYGPDEQLIVPSNGTFYKYNTDDKGKNVSIDVWYGDKTFTERPTDVEGWHYSSTELTANGTTKELNNEDEEEFSADSKFISYIVPDSHEVVLNLNGGHIATNNAPDGWDGPHIDNSSNRYTEQYKRTYYYGDTFKSILDPGSLVSTDYGWKNAINFNRISYRSGTTEEHYMLNKNQPFDGIDMDAPLTEDTMVNLKWDPTTYIEGYVYAVPDVGSDVKVPAKDAVVEYWTEDGRHLANATTNEYGYYHLEVCQISDEDNTRGMLIIWKNKPNPDDDDRWVAPNLFCEPNTWNIQMADSILSDGGVIQGQVKYDNSNWFTNLFTAEKSNEATPLEGVIVTLYARQTDDGPKVTSTYTTKTNELGNYWLMVPQKEFETMKGARAVFEFYSPKLKFEYVKIQDIKQSQHNIDYKFSNNNYKVTFDFNGGSLPRAKVPNSWKYNLDGSIYKYYQEGSWAPAIEQVIDTNDLRQPVDGDYHFRWWDVEPGGMSTAEIKTDTKITAVWEKKIDVPEVVEGLVYNGEEQVGVPEGEGYDIIENRKTNAGTYTATVVLKDGYIWSDLTHDTRYLEWSIEQKSLNDCTEISIPEEYKSITYDGEEYEPPVTVRDENKGKSIITTEDYTIGGNTAATVVGKYVINVIASPTGNYKDSVDIPWEIVQQKIPLPTLLIDPNNPPQYTGEDIIGVDVSQCNGRYNYAHERGLSAKTYHFVANILDRDNYVWDSEPPTTDDYSLDWQIIKQRVDVPKPVEERLMYNQRTQTGVKLPEGETRYELFNNTAKNAGAYTCIAKLLDTNNYCWNIPDEEFPSVNQRINWWIEKAIVNPPKLTYDEANPLIYNKTEQTGVEDPPYSAVYYVQGNKAINAGDYVAIAKLFEPQNYVWNIESETSQDLKIAWKILKKPTKRPIANHDLTYNGREQTGVSHPIGVEDLYTLTGNKATNASDYTASAQLIDASNYEWEKTDTEKATSEPITVDWTIKQKNIADKSVEISIKDGPDKEYTVYHITPKLIVEDFINVEGIDKPVNIITDKDFGLSGDTTQTNVKCDFDKLEILPYTITITASEDGNYTGSTSIDWKIIPHMVQAPAAQTNLVYNGLEQHGVKDVMGYYGYNIKKDTNKGTNAGDYETIFEIHNSAEHPMDVCWRDKEGKEAYQNSSAAWTIAKKDIAKTSFELNPTHYRFDNYKPLGPPDKIIHDYIYDPETEQQIDVIAESDYYLDGDNEAKSEVGTYKINLNAKDDGNYKGSQSKDWYIDESKVEVPKARDGLIYNGQDQQGVDTFETAYFFNTSETSTEPDPEQKCIYEKNAGNYTVWAHLKEGWVWKGTGKDQDKDPKQVTFTIGKKSINDGSVQLICSDKEFLYDRNGHTPQIRMQDIGATGEPIITENDYTFGGDLDKVTVPQDHYTTTVEPTETGNYAIYDGDSAPKWEWKIKPVSVSFTWNSFASGSFETVYNGQDQRPTANVVGILGQDKVSAEIHIKNVMDKSIKAGDYTAYVELTGDDAFNYWIDEEEATQTKDFTILKQQVDIPTAQTGLVYNGNSQVGVKEDVRTPKLYELNGTFIAVASGNYTANAFLCDKDDYIWKDNSSTDKEINWSIAKKPVEILWDKKTLNLTYNGEIQLPSAIVSNPCSQQGVADDVKPVIRPEQDVEPINQGTYTAIIDSLEGAMCANYVLPASVEQSFKIIPVKLTPPTIVDTSNYVYNGTTQEALVESADSNMYTMKDYQKIDAGQYKWVVSIKDKNYSNYVWSTTGTNADISGNWSIGQKKVSDIKTLKLKNDKLSFTGGDLKPELVIDDGDCTIDVEKDLRFNDYVAHKDVGEYSFEVVGTSGGNYTGSKTLNWSIIALNVKKPVAKTGLEYNGKTQTGVDTFGVTQGYNISGHQQKNAGTYTATASLWNGYKWDDGSSSELYINYTIKPRDINNASVRITGDSEFTYENKDFSVDVDVSDGGIISDSDYEVSNTKATNAGEYTISVKAKGINYTGTYSNAPQWKINKRNIYDVIKWVPTKGFDEQNKEFIYDGNKHGADYSYSVPWISKDVIQVKTDDWQANSNSERINKDKDAYWYKVSATGLYGSKANNFYIPTNETQKIFKYHIAPASVPVPSAKNDLVYNGKQWKIQDCINIDSRWVDMIDISCDKDIKNADTYNVKCSLNDTQNFWWNGKKTSDAQTVSFQIQQCAVDINWDKTDFTWANKRQMPNASPSTNYDGDNFQLDIQPYRGDNCTNYGDHYCVVDKFTGSAASNYKARDETQLKAHHFFIYKRSLDKTQITIEPETPYWTGDWIVVTVTIQDDEVGYNLTEGLDFEVDGNGAKDRGTHQVIVWGSDHVEVKNHNYAGKVTKEWQIIDKQKGILDPPYPDVHNLNYTGDLQQLCDPYTGTHSGTVYYELINAEGKRIEKSLTPIKKKDVGEYKLRLYATEDDTHAESKHVDLGTAKISNSTITYEVDPVQTHVYDGKDFKWKGVTKASTAFGTTPTIKYRKGKDGPYSLSSPPVLHDVEECTVGVQLSADGCDTVTEDFTISVTPAEITVDKVPDQSYYYKEGVAQGEGINPILIHTVDDLAAEIWYSWQGHEKTKDIPKFEDVGVWTINYEVTAKNHNSKTGSYKIEIKELGKGEINPAPIGKTLTYNEKEQELTYFEPGYTTTGEIHYIFNGKDTTTPPKAKDAGTYNYVVYAAASDKIARSDDYNITTVIEPESITYSIVGTQEKTYDGKPLSVTVNASTKYGDKVTVQYSESKDGPYSSTVPSITNAEDEENEFWYKLTAKNYQTVNESYTLKINPANIKCTAPDQTYDYDGKAHGVAVIAKTVLEKDADVLYSTDSGSTWKEDVPQFKDKGTYSIQFKATADNHNDYTNTYKITIKDKDRKPGFINPPFPTAKTLVYTGQEMPLCDVYTGSASGPIKYEYVNNEGQVLNTSDSPIQKKDVGTYKLQIYAAQSDEYTESEHVSLGEAKITEADITVTTDPTTTHVYDGEEFTWGGVTATTVDGSTATIMYRKGTSGSYDLKTPPTLTDRETCFVGYEVSAPNHKTTTGEKEISVTPATIEFEKVNDQSYEYNESMEQGVGVDKSKIHTAGSQNAKVEYKYDDNEWSEDVPKFIEPCNKVITYKITADNHNDAGGTYRIEIKKAGEGNITPPPQGKVLNYNGQEQELVNISGCVPTGTIHYVIDGNDTTTMPKAKDDGTYNITVYAAQTDTTERSKDYNVTTTIKPATFTYELQGETYKIYDGTPTTAKIVATSSVATDIIVEYSTTGQAGPYSTDAPSLTNAGEQEVWYKISATGHETVNDKYTLTVKNASISYKVDSVQYDVYNGTEFKGSGVEEIKTKGGQKYTLNYGTEEGKYDLKERPSITKAGLEGGIAVYYQITADNHNTATGVYLLGRLYASIECTYSDQSFEYNGQEQGNPVTAVSKTAKTETINVKYKFNADDEYNLDNAQIKNIGTQHVWFKASAPNHNDFYGEYNITITGEYQGYIKNIPKVYTDLVYNGSEQALSENYDGEIGKDCSGQVHFELVTSNMIVRDTSSVEALRAIDAGTYKLRIYAEAYGDYSASPHYDMGEAIINNAKITYSLDDNTNKDFDGTPFTWGGVTEATTVDSTSATIKYRKGETGEYNLPTPPAITNVADSCFVGVEITAKNHETVHDQRQISINPAEMQTDPIPNQEYYYEKDKLQGEQLNTDLFKTIGSSVNIKYSFDRGDKYELDVAQKTEVGVYTVYFKATAVNYKDYYGEYKLTIKELSGGYINPIPTGVNIEYDSKSHALTTIDDKTQSSGEIRYVVDGQDTTTQPVGTDAKSYDFVVYAAATPTTAKSPDYQIHAVINPAEITYEIVGDTERAFNGQELKPTVQATAKYGAVTEVEYSTDAGKTYSSTVPSITNVGKLNVMFRITANNHETVNGEYTLEITKADITCDFDEVQDFYYDGKPHGEKIRSAKTVTGQDAKVLYKFKESEDYRLDIAQQTNVGKYTVYFMASAENHNNYEGQYELNINEKSPGFINKLPEAYTLTYNGQNQALSGTVDSAVSSGPVVYEYIDTVGKVEQSDNPIVKKDAGTYKLRVYAKESDRYKESEHYEIGDAVIKGATIKYSVDEHQSGVFTGESLGWNGVTKAETIDGTTATVKYRKGDSGDFVSTTPLSPTYVADSGNYWIQITAKNHETVTEAFNLKITPATFIVADIEDQSFYYKKDTPQGNVIDPQAVIAIADDPFTIKYSFEEGQYNLDVAQKTDPGEYTVYYKISAANHADYLGQYKLTIKGLTPGKIDPTPEGVNLDFDGNLHELTTINKDTKSTGTIHYVIDGQDTTEPITRKNAGKYEFDVYAEATETSSQSEMYHIVSNIEAAEMNVSVKGDLSQVFDGTDLQAEVVADLPYGGASTIGYNTTGPDGDYKTTIPSIKDVGSQKVWYKVVAPNYKTVMADYTLEITKANIGYKVVEIQSKVYDGVAFNGTGVTDIKTQGEETPTLKFGKTEGTYDLTEAPSIINVAESCDVYFQIKAKNHEDATGQYHLELTKAEITCDAPDQTYDRIQGKYQGEKVKNIKTAGSQPATDNYKFDESAEYDLEVAQQEKVGTYHVWFKITAQNHKDLTGEYNLIINGTPQSEGYINPAPTDKTDMVYDGSPQTLADYAHDSAYQCSGEVVYELEDSNEWSSDPIMATDAKVYKLKVKVLESEGYTEKEYGPITVIINYKVEFFNALPDVWDVIDTQLVPRDNPEYKLADNHPTEYGWWYFSDLDVKKWKFDTDVVKDNMVLYNEDEIRGLDYYTMEELSEIADDLSKYGYDSKYYGEFAYYCATGEVWYSNSNGAQGDGSNIDVSKCNQDYKCSFEDAEEDIDQFMFLRIIGINHDYLFEDKSFVKKAGLTFETINAIPYYECYTDKDWEKQFPLDEVSWKTSRVRNDFKVWAAQASPHNNAFPESITSKMKTVRKFTYNFNESKMEQTDDKIFPLSVSEMHRYYSKAKPTGWEQKYLMPGRNPDNPYDVTFNPDSPLTDGYAYEWYIWDEYWSGNGGPYEHEKDPIFDNMVKQNSGLPKGGIQGVRLRSMDAFKEGYFHVVWKDKGLLDDFDWGDQDQYNYHIAFCL